MKRSTTAAIAIAAGALLLASVVIFRRHLPYTGTNLAPKHPPDVIMTIDDAYIIGLANNVKLWSIRAGSVQLAQNRCVVTLDNITDGKIFDKGKTVFKIRAGRIAYNIVARDLTITRGVRVEGAEGQKITARGAMWNSITGIFRSDGPVAFESKLGRITAKMMLVDVRNREMQMWDVVGSADVKAIEAIAGKEGSHEN